MDKSNQNPENSSPIGNPLDSTVGNNPVSVSEASRPSIPASSPLSSTPIPEPQINPVVLQNTQVPISELQNNEALTPPTPISSSEGTGSVTLDQTTNNLPQKSNTLGIIIGVMLLISIVVGASLYYYFFMYKKTTEQTPAPVTLIEDKKVVEATSQEAMTAPEPAPEVDPSISLLTEINQADQDLSNIDGVMTTFDSDIK